MSITARVAGAAKPIIAASVMVGDSLSLLRSVKVMSRGALRTILSPPAGMVVTGVPAEVSGFETSGHPQRVNSQVATASVTGGTAPYSYAWVRVSGDTRMTPTAPTMATTAFGATIFRTTIDAGFVCTVTDANGQTGTCDVAASVTHDDFS